MIMLSETLPSPSMRWAAVLHCCEAADLPVPESPE